VPDDCSHVLPPPTFGDSNLFHQRHSTSSRMVKQAHTQFVSPADRLQAEAVLSSHLKLVSTCCFSVYCYYLHALGYSVCSEYKCVLLFYFIALFPFFLFIRSLHNVQEMLTHRGLYARLSSLCLNSRIAERILTNFLNRVVPLEGTPIYHTIISYKW
jgi:hypothetical protein